MTLTKWFNVGALCNTEKYKYPQCWAQYDGECTAITYREPGEVTIKVEVILPDPKIEAKVTVVGDAC